MDRAAWFPLDQAAVKLTRGQVPILQDLTEALTQAQTER
jgi:predicted NUDIX family NTP pyrophosphohydrolase